ncbi:hypothetical protein ACP4OV_016616 [Aristida adscensionis]
MEVFDAVRFVRLRSVALGDYLAADVDGSGVCLTGQRGAYHTVWAVQEAASRSGDPCVLLRSAYGRYLVLDGDTQQRRQADLDEDPTPPSFLWRASRSTGSFVLQDSSGLYLLAELRVHSSLWDIEVVPVAADRPTTHDPVRQLVHRHTRPPRVNEVHRALRYVVAEADGTIDDDMGWASLEVRTNKLMEVRRVLQDAMHRQEDNFTICIRGGRYGLLTPLLTDLPIGNNPIDLVILNHGTPGDGELVYPLTAPTVWQAFLDALSPTLRFVGAGQFWGALAAGAQDGADPPPPSTPAPEPSPRQESQRSVREIELTPLRRADDGEGPA